MEIGDNRQQEHDERLERDSTAADYWQKREEDMRAQRQFWANWDNRFNGGATWPFKR